MQNNNYLNNEITFSLLTIGNNYCCCNFEGKTQLTLLIILKTCVSHAVFFL